MDNVTKPELTLLPKDHKFTPTIKRKILRSKIDTFNLIRCLQSKE